MQYWIIQVLNGISFGMLLFLLAAGLSIIFGLMKVINMAHGSFFLLGAYIGLAAVRSTDNFLLAVLAGASATAIVGAIMHRFFLRYLMQEALAQVLLTFGFLLIIGDGSLWLWGGQPQLIPAPSYLSGSVRFADIVFPRYRVFVAIVGLGAAAGLWVFQAKTKLGATVRAGIDNPEMTSALGVNVSLVMTMVFGAGAALAGVGGVIGGPFLGVYPGADFEVLTLAFVVVVVGGLGNFKGAFLGSIVVGLIDSLGKALLPELAMLTIFAPMALVLALKPEGLFGKT